MAGERFYPSLGSVHRIVDAETRSISPEHPSVEVPLGDFFACGWGSYTHVNSQPIYVNLGRAFNSYWPMPFANSARITLENRDEVEEILYYQVTYGTGTEDYFCGAYNFDIGTAEPGRPREYTEYSTAFSGLPQVIKPDGVYNSQQRFGMYRWHVMDPIRFRSRLRVTIQALGRRPSLIEAEKRYLPLRDDVASTAFWYQELPSLPLRPLQCRDELQVI